MAGQDKNNIELTFPDGKKKVFPAGTTLFSVAEGISTQFAKRVLSASLNGEMRDLNAPVNESALVEFYKFDSTQGEEVYHHSTSHLMAQAVLNLYPGTKYTIGPSIHRGFYYDFDCEHKLVPEDLEKIEEEMCRLASENLEVTRHVYSKKDAVSFFKEQGNEYKVEVINEIPDGETVTVYRQGDFSDLCRGPHLPSTGYIKAVKLTALAGAYWRGSEKNKMLQRIYGTSFPSEKELRSHLARIEEAKKRDHRKIGKELDLFSFHEEGTGFPFWHPKGTIIYNLLSGYIRRQNTQRGYDEIMTPIILSDSLWHKSGHWDNFKENMYFTEIDEKTCAIKPMNCPGGLIIYKNNLHSYRELPIKNAELGLVHRHELSGVLHGLFRVRSFTQDDAHVFCTPEQVEAEIVEIIDYTVSVYSDFGFDDLKIYVATKPDKAIGSDEIWENSTKSLKNALEEKGLEYHIKEGEGAFYGPKIEFNIEDCLGRNWQCGTIQVDFSMPERFELAYRGSDGKDHTPVMIHRAIFGSLERFIGILIENFAGKFPLWLAPVQIRILSVNENVNDYVQQIKTKFSGAGFRVETDISGEKLGYKIRLARTMRVSYIFILGDKEKQDKTISYRTNKDENGTGIDVDKILKILQDSVNGRQISEKIV